MGECNFFFLNLSYGSWILCKMMMYDKKPPGVIGKRQPEPYGDLYNYIYIIYIIVGIILMKSSNTFKQFSNWSGA